jgi:hypothetical protein
MKIDVVSAKRFFMYTFFPIGLTAAIVLCIRWLAGP